MAASRNGISGISWPSAWLGISMASSEIYHAQMKAASASAAIAEKAKNRFNPLRRQMAAGEMKRRRHKGKRRKESPRRPGQRRSSAIEEMKRNDIAAKAARHQLASKLQ